MAMALESRNHVSGKSDEAMRTIGEVADSLDLPQHVLRFWETRFKEIVPLKRAGGRRFYRQRDIELVIAIRHLLYHEGYTIKGVQRILKEQGVEAVIADVIQRQTGGGADGDETEPTPDSDFAQREAAERPGVEEIEEASEDFPAENDPDAIFEEGRRAPEVEIQPAATLPAVVVEPRPLAEAEARILREALAEIEECKRLLKLTRR